MESELRTLGKYATFLWIPTDSAGLWNEAESQEGARIHRNPAEFDGFCRSSTEYRPFFLHGQAKCHSQKLNLEGIVRRILR